MKILFLYRYGILGGVCTQIYHRLRHIDSSSDLEIHCGFRSNDGVETMLGEFATLHFGLTGENTRDFVEREGFDLVIVIDSEEYIVALRDMEERPKIAIEVHTSIESNLEYLGRLEEGDADIFITVSEYMRERVGFHRSESVNKLDIVKFENVLDTSLFERTEHSGEGGKVILWIGKIDDHKDWRKFLEICGIVTETLDDVEFWIVGGQTCSDERAQELFEEAENQKVISLLRWFDRVENDKIPQLISLVSNRGGVKIVTSHGESFGMSILESLLCGCPVISSNVGAIPEIWETCEYFQLYELGDAEKAAEIAIDLLCREKTEEGDYAMDEIRMGLVEKFSSALRSEYYWKMLQEIAN